MSIRKMAIGFILSALCVSTLTPLKAEDSNQVFFEDVMTESNEIAEILDDFGISTTDLLELNSMPKKESSFYNTKVLYHNSDPDLDNALEIIESKNIKPFRPSDYGLYEDAEKKSIQPRAPYDVNPPLNEKEQEERIKYIAGIIDREYYQDRYKDKIGKYYLYLYTSHWTENSNYERDGDNYFDKIYANIICQNDIDAFDTFYAKVRGGAVADVFVGLGETVSSLKEFAQGDMSKVDKITGSLKAIKASMGKYTDDITKSLSDQGFDTSTIYNIIVDMTKVYKDNYNTVENAEQMIELINDKMNKYGLSGYVTKTYVDLMSSILSDAIFTSFSIPFVCCGVYYFKVLADIYPMVTLASLYYSYSIRRADRLSIYLGLFDRP